MGVLFSVTEPEKTVPHIFDLENSLYIYSQLRVQWKTADMPIFMNTLKDASQIRTSNGKLRNKRSGR